MSDYCASPDRWTNLLDYVTKQRGAPPSPFATWDSLRAALAGLPDTDAALALDEVESAFSPNLAGHDFDSWSEEKRQFANHMAVKALAQAKATGQASAEQIRAMQAYTGFGGFKDIGVLPPEYPPAYVAASREYCEKGRLGEVTSPESNEIIGRVKDQYFTPVSICSAMHALVSRTNPTAQRYLETSAGIGRFLLTAPAGKDWSVVELDPLMADMVSAMYPTARVRRGYFEQVARGVQGQYDVVIGNPPYGKRGPSARSMDQSDVTDTVSYFFLAGAKALAPGGTLAYIVPLSFLTTANRIAYREILLKHCAFRGAALLPDGAFPSVYATTFAVVLFTRRGAPARAFTEREQMVIDGRYLELDEATGATCGGAWKEGPRGTYLSGRPDLSRIGSLWLSPPPDDVAVRPPVEPEAPTSGPEEVTVIVEPAPVVDQAEVDEAGQAAGQQLAATVAAWIATIVRDPQAAEAQRAGIRNAVVGYLAEVGNPHPRGPAALRAVTTKDGQLERVLEEPVRRAGVVDEPPDPATPAQLVNYWCERRGYAEPADLGGMDLDDLARDPDIYLDLRPEGPALLARWLYLTGSPAGILAGLDKALGNTALSRAVREKLESQKALVLSYWSAPRSLPEIDATPRSPFVPLDAVIDWVNSLKFWLTSDRNTLIPSHKTGEVRLSLVVEDTIMRPVEDEGFDWVMANRVDALDALYWLLAYCNRTRAVDSLTESSKTVLPYHGLDAAAVMRRDEEMVSRFVEWLGDSPWAAAVEADYNTKFAPALITAIPSDPVFLKGQGASVKLHPHQNQVVRRCSLGGRARPFLWGADVGAGKTFAGSATAMRWRQQGAALRPLVVVPASVIAKWYDDGRRLFPDARIGIIGITPIGPGKARNDTPDQRLEKWLRFAAGAYDYAICGHDTFERDIEPSAQEVGDVLASVIWARRGQAKTIAKMRRTKDKLTEAEARLVAYKRADSIYAWRDLFPRRTSDWAKQREGKIAEVEKEILTTKAALAELLAEEGLGTDSDIATVQGLLENILKSKPYRPNAAARLGEEEEEEDDEEDEDAPKKDKSKPAFTPLPGIVSWGDLGVDGIVVDEAHRFKNLWYPAQKIEYAAKGADELFGTKKAWDMFIKTRLIHRRAGGVGGILFLTATPVTNSPLELYTMLDMVNPQVFETAGIYDKEQFIERFWGIEIKDMPTAAGVMEPRPQLTAFVHGDELAGIINAGFQRLSIADLVARGWLKALPQAEPERLYFKRDAAQTALVRSLVATYVAWAKEKKEEEKKSSACGLTEMVDLTLWSPTPDGRVVARGKTEAGDAPAVMKERKTAYLARGTFQVIWMSMLDKVATAPMLLATYANKVRVRADDVIARMEKFIAWDEEVAEWEARGKRGPEPAKPTRIDERGAVVKLKRPPLKDYVRDAVATALLNQLDLEAVAAFYGENPVVPKIAELARVVAANVDRATFRLPLAREAVPEMQRQVDTLLTKSGSAAFVLVSSIDDATANIAGPSAQVRLVHQRLASARKVEPVKEQGRCGHVVFCDPIELHTQIRDAIVEASGGAISKKRIVFLPKPKAARLVASEGFNGADATSLSEAKEPIYDVVIGTSKLMAEGIDLQRRSCAVHHLDLPWEPATLHQRNGRAVRQGNTMGFVDVLYYLTEKSFDAIRFDKIAKKALWWDQLFSGQANTSNPAADKDSAADLDEIILGLVIEDEATLATCVEQLRSQRAAEQVVKNRSKAEANWIALNTDCERARAQIDEARRTAALGNALRKWKMFQANFPELLDGVQGLENDRVLQEVLAVDWTRGTVVRSGQNRSNVYEGGIKYKVARVDVKPKGFIAEARQYGMANMSSLLATSTGLAVEVGPWTYDNERAELLKNLRYDGNTLPGTFALFPPDLLEHATDLWDATVEQLVSSKAPVSPWARSGAWYVIEALNVGPLFVLPNGSIAVLGSPTKDYFPGVRVHVNAFIQDLRARGGATILPLNHPEARSKWLAALRADEVFVPTLLVGGNEYGALTKGRAALTQWTKFHQRMFGKGGPGSGSVAEVLRQRGALTNELKETK